MPAQNRIPGMTVPRRLAAVLAVCATAFAAGCGGDEETGSGGRDALRVSTSEWKTDFSRHSVALSEFNSGGPGRDGIPPIDKPRYVPRGDVLSRDTGFSRDYGRNPYEDYDTPDEEPFLFDGETDRRLPAKERVAAVFVGDSATVVPFSRLRREGVASFEVEETPVVVMFKAGVASALDEAQISQSEDVGTSSAFDRRLNGRVLSFERRGDTIVDRQTGSRWDITGRATAGPLRGERLTPVRHDQQFWFALAAFLPEARIVSPGEGGS